MYDPESRLIKIDWQNRGASISNFFIQFRIIVLLQKNMRVKQTFLIYFLFDIWKKQYQVIFLHILLLLKHSE